MAKYLYTHRKRRQYLLLLGDILALAAAVGISYAIRVQLVMGIDEQGVSLFLSRITPWLLLVLVPHVFTLYLLDLYNINRPPHTQRSAILIALSVAFAGLIISGIFFFVPKYVFGRQVLLIHLMVTTFTLTLWRVMAYRALNGDGAVRRLALVGDTRAVRSFAKDLAALPNCGYTISHICAIGDESKAAFDTKAEWTRCATADELLGQPSFESLAFDSSHGTFDNDQVRRILELKQQGKAIYDLSTLYENITGKIPLTYTDGNWLLRSEGLQGEHNPYYARIKRLIDCMLALVLMVVFSPFFIVIPVLIKLTSKGPVLFRQERLGQNRIAFTCVKFRTMRENCEDDENPTWSSDGDPRITAIGRLLRKTRLDELPQFWNILTGEMSFVGPRPIRESFAVKLAEQIPFYDLRFAVKPGLSGWAQVRQGYAGSEEEQLEKFQYELFYIENMSLFLDILVIVMTVRRMLRGGGGT
jgi:exopolysaccharide biosynthesis polyprenyl glycosylphosphotransferase